MRISYRVLILALVFSVPFSFLKAKAKQKELPVFLADPTIFYSNGIYFLYGTEPNPEIGFPVLVSKDLINWNKPKEATNNGYALMKGKQIFGSTGFWAPQVIAFKNKFYMLYTANENIALAVSNSPYGPFTQKKIGALPSNTKQIDPFLFIDEDGKKYLYHVKLGGGNKIFVAEFKDDFSGIREETLKECISAEGGWEDTKRIPAPPIVEGPTVLKHKGIYYLFYSANDFRNIDYAVGYATSKSPMGPWTKNPDNPIINRLVIGKNGTGHGDVFKDEKGNYYYVFHSHNSESNVLPRQTFIVGLKFMSNHQTKIDDIVIDKSRMIIPVTHH
ncbi:MAG TPA: glycoside hydrolase family 43 protein [Paludibacter sp.]